MSSGIYRLVFPSGRFYIGKSTDMTARWNQHRDNLTKGTAAVRVQQEYSDMGSYKEQVLVKCHPDHLDLLENYFLNNLDKASLLNTVFPQKLSEKDYSTILANLPMLAYSTTEMIAALDYQQKTIKELQAELLKRRIRSGF